MENDTKLCPFCGEKIKAIAKKCKFCGEFLEEKIVNKVELIKCPYCAEEISSTETTCPHCDEKLTNRGIVAKDVSWAILEYINSVPNKPKCILTRDEITPEFLEKYKLDYDKDETPLMVMKSTFIAATKLIITNKKIYFKAYKDSFLTGIFERWLGMNIGSFIINNAESIEIADHDHCYGTAYFGHQLKLNDFVVGLIRMGTGLCYDDKVIKYLNGLFDYLAEQGIIKNKVREYAWQD